jgi:hypothetical protein
MYAIII